MPEPASHGASQTQTETQQSNILHLRADTEKTKKTKKKTRAQVRWTEDVVDNENMNKKKSKICCIFHPQRAFGEDSDSCLSDSDSSDSSGDEAKPQRHTHECKNLGNAYETQPHYKNHSNVPDNAI